MELDALKIALICFILGLFVLLPLACSCWLVRRKHEGDLNSPATTLYGKNILVVIAGASLETLHDLYLMGCVFFKEEIISLVKP